jgi:dTDP-4-dehydrorhamnose 3,5-epimerase-like enzyme
MAHIIDLMTFEDKGGCLTVVEKALPFEIKKVFYIYNAGHTVRGEHRHRKTMQGLICLKGSCVVYNNDGEKKTDYILDSPEKCLILEPKDWHRVHKFTDDCILLVLASEYFDPEDYIYEEYD